MDTHALKKNHTYTPGNTSAPPQSPQKSLFRSLSESRKFRWRSGNMLHTTNNGEASQTRSSAKIRKLHRSGSATRSQGTVESDSSFETRSSPPVPRSKLPRPDRSGGQDGAFNTTEYEHFQSPSNSPLHPHRSPNLRRIMTEVTGMDAAPPSAWNAHADLQSPLLDLSPDSNQRRKATMSKLMRHFGETRIPLELLVPSPTPRSVPESGGSTRSRRPKSLDLRSMSDFLENLESKEVEGTQTQQLHRARSLGTRTTRSLLNGQLDNSPETAETYQAKIRRARKMTKIFGPELTHDLMVNAEEHSGIPEMELDKLTANSAILPQNQRLAELRLAELYRRPLDFVDVSTDSTDDVKESEDTISLPPSPISPTMSNPFTEHRKRAKKLANFFGVDQFESPGLPVVSQPPPAHPPRPLNEIPSSATEIDVKVAGRRFWGLSPVRSEYRQAHMSDAIQQLRSLKAG